MFPKDFKIDQRYQYLKTLGDGLSGQVFLVQDQEGKKALKFLKKVQLNVSRDEALENFKQEFSILKELNHPNIARILDFGYDCKLEKYYFTSEFVEGKDFVAACAEVPFEQKEKLIVQVLRALNYLHNRHIYHFDIKPQNILVSYEAGTPKLAKIIDFGLAGFASPRKKVGTPAFMSPEVVQGSHLDGRADIYSLGVVIYMVLTGTNPFQSNSLRQTLQSHLHLVVRAPTQVNPDLPEYWDHIATRLLEKNPVHRFSQASLVIRDLNYLSQKSFDIETEDTKLSYLPERGALIGREKEWKIFTELFARIFLEDAGGAHLLVIEGQQGTGKSRLISEIKYFSQLRNIPVLSKRQLEAMPDKQQAFVLVVDENEGSVDQINVLFQQLLGQRCLLVWAAERAPQNWENTTVLELGSYSKSQLKNYLESVTGLANTPQQLIDEIFARTRGNPLFVTEFVRALLQKNMLFDKSGKWDATTFQDIEIDFDRMEIPDSLEDYYLGQYRLLEDCEREIVMWLAVNQEELHADQMKSLVSPLCRGQFFKVLMALVEKEIIRKTSREHTYFLANPVMAGLIQKQISPQDFSRHHDILSGLYQDGINRERYWFHLAYGTDRKKAFEALLQLGKFYSEEQRHMEAVLTYEQLHNIIKPSFPAQECLDVMMNYSEALIAAHRYGQACELLRGAVAGLCEHCVDVVKDHFEIMDHLLNALFKANHYEEIRQHLEMIRRAGTEGFSKANGLIAKNYLGFLHFHDGKIDEAETVFKASHDDWQKLKPEDQEQVTNNRLIDVYLFRNKLSEAVQVCQESIRVFGRTKNRFKLASLYYALGDLYYRLLLESGDREQSDYSQLCLDQFFACEKMARKIHHEQLLYSAFNGLGNLYYHREQYDHALTYYQRALTVARKVEEYNLAAILAHNISNTHKKLGQWQDAYAHIIYAINTLENVEKKNSYLWTMLAASYLELAELQFLKKDTQKSMQALSKVSGLLQAHAFLSEYAFNVQLMLAKVYQQDNNVASYAKALQSAKTLAASPLQKQELEKFVHAAGAAETTQVQNREQGDDMAQDQAQNANALDDLERITEINKFINSEHNLDQLLKQVLNYALEFTNAEYGFVILIENDDINQATVRASVNASASDQEKISMSIVRMAIENGDIVSSADAIQDERFDAAQSVILHELKSVLCLPIMSKSKCVGVFYLDNRFKTSAFEDSNIMVLKAFCDQVGIALENAKLIQALKAAKQQLENKLNKTEEELAEVKQILTEEVGQYQSRYSYDNIISNSKQMHDVFRLIDKVTETNLAIFIHGASGTGKELIAKALHYNNPVRKDCRFVAVNCGAIPHNLMESELFGHKAGSFTGAVRDKKGMFEEANGGTLLLDEIGELPLELQVKLLRVLQEGEVQRVGDNHSIKINVRVVSASHRDIEEMLREKKFREDLYYRLCQMKINLPPLCDRKEDIPFLAKHFVKKYLQQNKIQDKLDIPPDFMKALLEYSWPGNIRELGNLISVACALAEGGRLNLRNLPSHYGIMRGKSAAAGDATCDGSAPASQVKIDDLNIFDPEKTWRDYEAILIARCYADGGRKKKVVAAKLGLSHSTIYKKIDELKLDDESNPLYASKFNYDGTSDMEAYIKKIFRASLVYHDNHPYAAIRQLGVSQGYFYKVMKQIKGET